MATPAARATPSIQPLLLLIAGGLVLMHALTGTWEGLAWGVLWLLVRRWRRSSPLPVNLALGLLGLWYGGLSVLPWVALGSLRSALILAAGALFLLLPGWGGWLLSGGASLALSSLTRRAPVGIVMPAPHKRWAGLLLALGGAGLGRVLPGGEWIAAAGLLGLELYTIWLLQGGDRYRETYEVLASIVRFVEAKDPLTYLHSERVSAIARDLVQEMGAPHLEDLARRAGVLHDVGKVGVPEGLLVKSTPLSLEERREIETHPLIGYWLLKPLKLPTAVMDGVLYHHERWDGKGYPYRLEGEAIPLIARIIAVADAYEAATADRTYRQGRPPAEVLQDLRQEAGKQFDPQVVEGLRRVARRQPLWLTPAEFVRHLRRGTDIREAVSTWGEQAD